MGLILHEHLSKTLPAERWAEAWYKLISYMGGDGI